MAKERGAELRGRVGIEAIRYCSEDKQVYVVWTRGVKQNRGLGQEMHACIWRWWWQGQEGSQE